MFMCVSNKEFIKSSLTQKLNVQTESKSFYEESLDFRSAPRAAMSGNYPGANGAMVVRLRKSVAQPRGSSRQGDTAVIENKTLRERW